MSTLPGQPVNAGCSPTIFECESNADRFRLVAFGANWSIDANPAHSNSYARKNTNTTVGAGLQVMNRGENFCLYGVVGPDKGIVNIMVEGLQAVFEVDCYAETEAYNTLLFDFAEALDADVPLGDLSTLSFLISTTNTKNAESSGNDVILDRIEFTSRVIKVDAVVSNPLCSAMELRQLEKAGGGDHYTVEDLTVTIVEDLRGYVRATCYVEVSNLDATNVTIGFRQGVETGEAAFLDLPYTPSSGAPAPITEDGKARHLLEFEGEVLLVDVKVNGAATKSADVELYLVKRAG